MTQSIIKEKLDEKIPRDVISSRQAGNGRYLDYLEGWYVIDRLNRVFGQGNWAYTSSVTLLHQGKITNARNQEVNTVHYAAQVRLVVDFGNSLKTEFVDYGYGDGTDPANPGKAHELAIKESVTDGLKRCAKNLGMSFGLALYDKTQEFVDDSKSGTQSADKAPESKPEPIKAAPQAEASAPVKDLTAVINDTARVVIAKKKSTKDDLKKYMKETFNVESAKELKNGQSEAFLNHLKGMLA